MLKSRYDKPQVGLVIPVYNGTRFLHGLLNSIFKNHGQMNNYLKKIVIVSNEGEEDGTNRIAHDWAANMAVQRRAPIDLIANEKNLGFGPSCNQGIRRIFDDRESNYVCVFNVDQLVREYWLYWLLRALTRDERIGMATSNLIEGPTGQGFADIPFDDIVPGKPMTIFHRSKGCPWLFPRHVLEEIGLFDEQFVYSQWEDTDLCVRVARAGWDFVQVKNSYAFHFVGSEGQAKARQTTGRDFAAENAARFGAKWGTTDSASLMPAFHRPIVENVL